jgi:hypothetical protein
MSDYINSLRLAHWHAVKCVASIARARRAFGDDPGDFDDEPSSDEADYGDDPDALLPAGRPADNPQRSRGRYLPLIG